jgi:hypothetical protein
MDFSSADQASNEVCASPIEVERVVLDGYGFIPKARRAANFSWRT